MTETMFFFKNLHKKSIILAEANIGIRKCCLPWTLYREKTNLTKKCVTMSLNIRSIIDNDVKSIKTAGFRETCHGNFI